MQHSLRNEHGGQKPPELCADLIQAFTKKGQAVLDPFMGVGGVLLGASLCGRTGVGIELNPRWIEIYREVCGLEGVPEQEAILGDARKVLGRSTDRTFDCVLTDVPYWKMDTAARSPGTFKRVGEKSRPARKSKLSTFHGTAYGSKEEWLLQMRGIFERARRPAEASRLPGQLHRGHVQGEHLPLPLSDLAGVLATIPGLVWKANLIWYDVSKKLHLYGYQYAYIPSLIHQNILVFRKE